MLCKPACVNAGIVCLYACLTACTNSGINKLQDLLNPAEVGSAGEGVVGCVDILLYFYYTLE